MNKKVVFYLSDFQSGGTEWFAVRLACALKAKGYTPLFLVTQKKGELISLIQKEFDVTILGGKGYCMCAMIRTLPAVRRFLKEQQPTAIISGLPLLNFNAAMALHLNKQTCNHIAVEHMRQNEKGTFIFNLKQKMKQSLIKWVHKKATHAICVSKTVRDDVINYIGTSEHKLKVIYNPIIPPNLEELKKEATLHRWVQKKEGPLLLAIGRLLPVKDFKTLLNALKLVVEIKPVRLILLGEGTDLYKLETLVQELKLEPYVSMPGTVKNVFPYLNAADLFVLSSRQEAFGNVIVEALACGTPVVSTKCGGPEEMIKDGENGFLVPVADPKAMSEAILKALETPFDHEAFGKKITAFHTEKATETYIKLIEAKSDAL